MNDKQYTQEMIKNLNNRLKTKQEALTFDNTPTEGSVNPVTSEGIKAYIDSSKGTTYTAGENITISENNVINATDTKYTAGTNITISENNVISSTTDVSGTDDGTNWTSLTVNNNTKAIPQGVKIVDGFSDEWIAIQWEGENNSGRYIWTDGENIYYSYNNTQKILNKSVPTWSDKIWTGLTRFYGQNIWTDGENIYYSENSDQYVLDKATSTWSPKTWTGLTNFDGRCVWTDGENIYYSDSLTQYVLNKSASTWSPKTWTGLTNFIGLFTWTDGENIYYSDGSSKQYVLNKATSTWSSKTWQNFRPGEGSNVWTDGENIYYSDGYHYKQYVLDKSTSTWNTKTWQAPSGVDPTRITGADIWTDGENIYYYYISSYMDIFSLELKHTYKTITVLAKVAETGDYSDLKNKIIVNPILEGNEEKLTGLEVENVKYKVPEIKIKDEEWIQKIWTGLTDFNGSSIWTDGENIYCSSGSNQYVLDKSTSTWTTKIWTGLTNFYGSNIWTDGENIYYSLFSTQYVLDKATSTWSTKSWTGLTNFYGSNIWTDGENIYYSSSSNYQYELNKTTSTWSTKTWTGLAEFYGSNIWTDGNNIYYSSYLEQYVLDKATSTWSQKTWTGLTDFSGQYIWGDGDVIYYSDSLTQYMLDKSTSTWSTKTWTGLTDFSGFHIWTDGENIYYSNNNSQFQLKRIKTATVLAKVSETGDYNDLKNKPVIPEEKTIYTYSISISKGTDTITLINIQTLEVLSNSLTFGDLINNIYLNILAAEGDYTAMQGVFGFIDSKSNTQFTVSFTNGNSYTFASTDTLTITTHLEQNRIFYSRN